MDFNKKQKAIIIITVIIIAFMILIPPWAEVIIWHGVVGLGESSGYSLIFLPPKGARIDIMQLFAQIIGVLIITFCLLLIFKEKDFEENEKKEKMEVEGAKGDLETSKGIMEEGEGKKCPFCGNYGVHQAYIEDGGLGDWCPHCEKGLPKEEPPDLQKAMNKIKIASNFGILFGVLSLIHALVNIKEFKFSIMLSFLFFGLSYGSYVRKSIFCSYVLSFLLFLTIFGSYGGYQGLKGIIEYEKLISKRKTS